MAFLISLSSKQGVSVDRVEVRGKKLVYRGLEFSGWDKPIVLDDNTRYKRAVLARKGKFFKLIRYGNKGYEDFTIHKDEARRERFRTRFRGILKKDGKPAYRDKWQAAYWAYYDLW